MAILTSEGWGGGASGGGVARICGVRSNRLCHIMLYYSVMLGSKCWACDLVGRDGADGAGAAAAGAGGQAAPDIPAGSVAFAYVNVWCVFVCWHALGQTRMAMLHSCRVCPAAAVGSAGLRVRAVQGNGQGAGGDPAGASPSVLCRMKCACMRVYTSQWA